MIGWLQGYIIDSPQPGKLVLNVQGVGYDVETSLQTYFQLEGRRDLVSLHVQTIVREDAFLLYGFIDTTERQLFRALIKVNGVGPKLAMAVLSSITPSEFIHCIQQNDAAMLTKLPGIGKKTAERLVVEMRDSIKQVAVGFHDLPELSIQVNRVQEEAISALTALGYRPQDAAKTIAKLDDGQKSCEQLIRQGLQMLSAKG